MMVLPQEALMKKRLTPFSCGMHSNLWQDLRQDLRQAAAQWPALGAGCLLQPTYVCQLAGVSAPGRMALGGPLAAKRHEGR